MNTLNPAQRHQHKIQYILTVAVVLLFMSGCNHAPVNTDTPQVEKIDSTDIPKERLDKYKQQFEEADNDVDKLKALMDAAFVANDVPEEKKAVIQQLADFTETVPDCEVKASAYCTLITLYEESDVALSFKYFEKALELIPKFSEYGKILKAGADIRISYTASLYTEYGSIRQDFFDAMSVLETIPEKDYQKIADKTHIGINDALTMAYHTANAFYQFYGRKEKVAEYSNKLLALAEKNDNLYDKASGYYGYAYSVVSDEPDKALEYIKKGYQIGMETQYVEVMIFAHDLFAEYEEAKGNIPGAIAWIEKDLEYLKGKQKDFQEMIDYERLLSLCALTSNRFEDKLEIALKGLSLADSLKSNNYLDKFHGILATMYSKMGNYKEACHHQVKRMAIQEELRNETNMHQINFLTARYDAERREMKIREMEEQAKVHKVELVVGLSVCAIIIILLSLLLRLRKHRNKILAEMNATKDKFFSIISHDLKNPAIAQRDAIQQLIENAHLWNNNELIGYCTDLLKSADEEVELLYTLLNWAQIQTGRMSFTPVTFDLPAQLHTDIALIRKMATFKNITITERLPNHALVTGDVNMLATVIRNLLTNAVKFTPVGGEIIFAVEPTPDGKHIVSVNDTGTGMTPEEIQNLFNINKLHIRTGTIGEQGSGLGLIVCKELLEKHKTTLHVESEEGKGSKFWFEIT